MYKLRPARVYAHDRVEENPDSLARMTRMLRALGLSVGDTVEYSQNSVHDVVRELLAWSAGKDVNDRSFLLSRPLAFTEMVLDRGAGDGDDPSDPQWNPSTQFVRCLMGRGPLVQRIDRREQGPGADVVCWAAIDFCLAWGCPHGCRYCSAGQWSPFIAVGANVDEYMDKVVAPAVEARSGQKCFGVIGPTADVITLEPEFGVFGAFLQKLSEYEGRYGYFHTSSDNVDWVAGLPHRDRLIGVWSLAAEAVSRELEPGTPSAMRRIVAARRCQDLGIPVRFKLKPVIPVRNWRDEYATLIEAVFKLTRPESIGFCVLTCMSLRDLGERIALDSLDPALVTKAASAADLLKGSWQRPFPHEARSEIYRHLIREVRRRDADIPVFLSTESPDMWDELQGELGQDPRTFTCGCSPIALPGRRMAFSGELRSSTYVAPAGPRRSPPPTYAAAMPQNTSSPAPRDFREPDIVRKDASPEETIERVYGVLDSLGFSRGRAGVRRWTAGDDCHSCHLRFSNYPLIYANGKGVTPELAEASALAEFIERLQCRADALFTDAGNIHRLPPIQPRRLRTYGDVAAVAPRLSAGDLRELASDPTAGVPCLPFVDVLGGRVVDLPYDLLCMATGSSGMCAGNTPEEAVAHGICEVFERHAIHALERGRVRGFPTLPLGTLPVRSGVVRRQLDALASAGTDVLVKDATLGGLVPVVAVVLLDRTAGTCHVSFGSDPVFEAAVSRCITEAFQGTSRLFRSLATPGGPAAPLDTYNNLEVFADRLAADVGAPRIEDAFCDAASNADALRFVVGRVRRMGLGLYVRDVSIFGFPAYYVYVEELSALRQLRPLDVQCLSPQFATVRTTIFRLAQASTEEVARCSAMLFDEMTCCNPTLEQQFVSGVLRAPVATCLDLRTLLVLMLLEAGSTGQARTVMEWPPPSAVLATPASVEGVAAWLAPYVETRRRAAGVGQIAANFDRAFGPGRREADAVSGSEQRELPVPRCQSIYDCPACPCHRYCRLDEWYRLARRLREQAVTVRQEDLLARLRSRRGTRSTRRPSPCG